MKKATNKATKATANKATKKVTAVNKKVKQKSQMEVSAINLVKSSIARENQTREEARKDLFNLISSLATLVHVLPREEKKGITSPLSTQFVNFYIFEHVFGYTKNTPSDETRVARTRVQIAKAIWEDKREGIEAIDSVEDINEAYKAYIFANFATYKEMVEFAKGERKTQSPKSANDKLLTLWENLKNMLDESIDENGDTANAFVLQAIEFLSAKTATNKAKKSLNYGAKKAA